MEDFTIDGVKFYYSEELGEYIEMVDSDSSDSSNLSIEISKKAIPPFPDIGLWEEYLGRNLTKKEKEIITDLIEENITNEEIEKIKLNLSNINCYIPVLSNSNGNCLFESLVYAGLEINSLGIEPSDYLRQQLSGILLTNRNNINFFPNLNQTPEEIFINANEIETVKDKKTKQVYKYDYDIMILDIQTDKSWKRLPTELILMTVSQVYNVEILIHHNNSKYINRINMVNNDTSQTKKIRLVLINEEHYIPVKDIPEYLINDSDTIQNISKINLVYIDAREEYDKWISSHTNNPKSIISKNKSKTNTKESIFNLEDYDDIDFDNFF